MDSIFKISKLTGCKITITGLELDNQEYLDEDGVTVSTRKYTYTQSTTINVLTSIDSKQNEILEDYKVNLHNVDCIDESEMQTQLDGLYRVSHIILPNEKWLLNILSTSKDDINVYTNVYYYDETDEQFKKYNKDKDSSSVVDFNEIFEINPTLTTVIRGDKNTFQLCHLRECFFKYTEKILGEYPTCDMDATRILNRDILWMAINTIKYMLEEGSFYEAQRILEEVTGCGTVCQKINNNQNNSSNCGCA